MSSSRVLLFSSLVSSLVGLSGSGCYSDAWIADLAAETGDTNETGGEACEAGELQCSADGVARCVDGNLVADRSNVGCEFVAATLPQTEGVEVVLGLANPGLRSASVTVELAGASVGELELEPGAGGQLAIPWNAALGLPSSSGVIADAAVVVRSTEPIAAFQINQGAGAASSSDASTLLPRHVWGSDYFALAHPHYVPVFGGAQGPAFWAALTREDLNLSVTGGAATSAVAGGGIDASGTGQVALMTDAAAVLVTASAGVGQTSCGWNPSMTFNGCGRPPLQDPTNTYPRQCAFLPTEGGACMGMAEYVGCCANDGAAYYCSSPQAGMWTRETCPPLFDGSDLSGSRITSDRPFALFAGSACTSVPAYEQACDHLEEQLWPVETESSSYAVIAPSLDATPQSHLVRVLALEGPVDLSFAPAVAQAPTSIAGAGQYVDIHISTDIITTASFVLGASGPIQVIQLSHGPAGGVGDPAMLAVPSLDQAQREMAFHVPSGFTTASLSIVGPVGTVVQVDGNSATLTASLGSELAVGRVGLGVTADGFHRISADAPVFASVFARNGSNSTLWYMAGAGAGD